MVDMKELLKFIEDSKEIKADCSAQDLFDYTVKFNRYRCTSQLSFDSINAYLKLTFYQTPLHCQTWVHYKLDDNGRYKEKEYFVSLDRDGLDLADGIFKIKNRDNLDLNIFKSLINERAKRFKEYLVERSNLLEEIDELFK